MTTTLEHPSSSHGYETELIDDGWHGTRIVHLRAATPTAVRVVDDALPAALAREIYEYTMRIGQSWGTYVPLPSATAEESSPPAGTDGALFSMARRLVQAIWLSGSDATELLTPELHRVHGFALWANIGGVGEECAYHVDYAELHRRRTSLLHPPLLASTVHVAELDADAGDMAGGCFGVNTGGLQHYLQFGHHCVLKRHEPSALEYDWENDSRWIKVSYRFRRAILMNGLLPHRATTISAMPEDKRRVVVGINVFDKSIGEQVAAAPVHSDAYRAAMRELQAFSRVSSGVSLASEQTTLVAVGGGEPTQKCSMCRSLVPSHLAPVLHEQQLFCSVACLKTNRSKMLASTG